MSPSNKEGRMKMSRVSYVSAMESLMFVMIYTIPDIAYAMRVVSRHMAKPGREHWKAVKMILRCIKGTSDVAYVLGNQILLSKDMLIEIMQLVVAMSTKEAKYVTAAEASKEAVWMKMLLEELEHEQEKITLFCDNKSALYLARNPTFHSKTKRVRVQYHFVHEKVKEETVDMQKIHTDDIVAYYLTKAVTSLYGADPHAA
uniref:Retrovirus-related Pol polyprotein from transposon TNT 1-94 n=1 Tax=Tanacetum cinerariifolium TaxID=118510 RepID=A0A6L2L2I2_TANCI|nr:hypothetical protein [Tanacetum cinerariifolium]